MTGYELERAIEVLLAQQAKLTAGVTQFTSDVNGMKEEMREAFSNLILDNEVTRDLANRIGELAVNNSRGLTRVELELNLE